MAAQSTAPSAKPRALGGAACERDYDDGAVSRESDLSSNPWANLIASGQNAINAGEVSSLSRVLRTKPGDWCWMNVFF